MINDPQRAWEAYFQVLSWWGTPAQLEAILRRITPDELLRIMREAGSPEEMAALVAELKADRERSRWWRRTVSGLKEALVWFGLGGGALAALLAARAVWRFWAGS
jgi:hypothetical protein